MPLIADGGINRDGALSHAPVGGDTAMLGSAFAGTRRPRRGGPEAGHPARDAAHGEVPFKVLRGMASVGAIQDRLDLEDADDADIEALGAEGREISVPARRSVRIISRT